jgi:DNA-binding NarL/FixJ family response regulator
MSKNAGEGHSLIMTIRVLICESRPMFSAGLRRVLDDVPDIEVVGDVHTGIAAIDSTRERAPDVVVLDSCCAEPAPGLIITELAEALRPQAGGAGTSAAPSHAGVIILDEDVEEVAVRLAFGAGARGYLLRTGSIEDLVYGIRAVAGGGGIIDPALVCALVTHSNEMTPPIVDGTAFAELTDRERDVLRLLTTGLSNQEIAARLWIQPATVKSHVSRLLGKLGVRDRIQAAAIVHRHPDASTVRDSDGPPMRLVR